MSEPNYIFNSGDLVELTLKPMETAAENIPIGTVGIILEMGLGLPF